METMKKINIALDGVVSSWKGTTAMWVAKRLWYVYLDTWASYRAIAWYCIKNNIDVKNSEKVIAILSDIDIQMKTAWDGTVIIVNWEDVTSQLRSMIVSNSVPYTSAIPQVRAKLREIQKEVAAQGWVVIDGRDIWTDVLPNAELKVFMIWDMVVRAKRRQEEYRKKHNDDISLDEIIANIKLRDDTDYFWVNPTCKRAQDAIDLDTTHLTIDEQIDRVVEKANNIINPQQ